MATDDQVYHYDVPAGFPAMSLPTAKETRLPKDKIKLEAVTPDDLKEFCKITYESFPEAFWNGIETSTRPSLEERCERLAKHLVPWLSYPGYSAIKATHADTGELMGVAGWIESGRHRIYPTKYSVYPEHELPDSFVPCILRDDIAGPLRFDERQGWTAEEMKHMYSHHSPKWGEEFASYDVGRIKEVGSQPHWYLTPLAVKEAWRGRGIGKELLMWGIEKADAAEPPVPIILHALPNARPAYYHVGFKPTTGFGPCEHTQIVRPARANKGPQA